MSLKTTKVMGFCARGGHRIRRQNMVMDPDRPGFLVDKSWSDRPHPQRYMKEIAPDRGLEKGIIPERWMSEVTVVFGSITTIQETPVPSEIGVFIGAITVDPDVDGYGLGDFSEGTYGS